MKIDRFVSGSVLPSTPPLPARDPARSLALRSWLIILLPSLVAGLVLAAMTNFSPRAAEPPEAVAGRLDLSGWDFRRDGAVSLCGEWSFASAGRVGYIRVPGQWTGTEAGGSSGKGHGIYTLLVALPRGAPPLSIRVPTVATAYALRADGAEIAAGGRPSADPAAAVPGYAPLAVGLDHDFSGRTLRLDVEVSNWEYRVGGMWRPLVLGSSESIEGNWRLSYFLSIAFFAALITLAVAAVAFFVMRRSERSFLRFALLAATVALRSLVTGEYSILDFLPGISFDTVVRIEYYTAFALMPLVTLLFLSLFPAIGGRAFRSVALLPFAPLLLALSFVPLDFLTRSIYAVYPLYVANIAMLAYKVIFKVLPRERIEASVVASGGLLLLVFAMNDALYVFFVIATGNLFPLGLLLFLGALGGLISRRLVRAFGGVERLSADLADELAANEAIRRQLESTLAEKELLINEIHHRVKNSLQIVSSFLSLQSNRTEDPAAKETFAAMKNRIRSISLVHEKLYGTASSARITLGGYLRDLAALLSQGYGKGEGEVKLVLEGDAEVSVEFCVDAGLILNEVVANCFKHGAGPEGGLDVGVRARVDGEALLIDVTDAGRGFPEGFDPDSSGSLGLKIVKTLLRRSGGNVSYGRASDSGGARVSLSIPLLWQT